MLTDQPNVKGAVVERTSAVIPKAQTSPSAFASPPSLRRSGAVHLGAHQMAGEISLPAGEVKEQQMSVTCGEPSSEMRMFVCISSSSGASIYFFFTYTLEITMNYRARIMVMQVKQPIRNPPKLRQILLNYK